VHGQQAVGHHQYPRPERSVRFDWLINPSRLARNATRSMLDVSLFYQTRMPASYREMDGFGVHAFRLVNAQGQQIFAKSPLCAPMTIEHETH